MDLKTFVSETLTQIAEGIIDAQEKSDGKYQISPVHNSVNSSARDHDGQGLECVSFDIAVGINNAVDGEGVAHLAVVNGALHGSHEKTETSRVSFQVFVRWPQKEQ